MSPEGDGNEEVPGSFRYPRRCSRSPCRPLRSGRRAADRQAGSGSADVDLRDEDDRDQDHDHKEELQEVFEEVVPQGRSEADSGRRAEAVRLLTYWRNAGADAPAF